MRVRINFRPGFNQLGNALPGFHLGIVSRPDMNSMGTNMSLPTQEVMDRRPIATRNRKWAQTATHWLAVHQVSPNAISMAGMCGCIVAGMALAATSISYHRIEWIVAVMGVQLRLIANMPDGMGGHVSGPDCKVGEFYNQFP